MSASPARNISETKPTYGAFLTASVPFLTVSLVAWKWKWPRLNCTAPRTNSQSAGFRCARSLEGLPISRPRSANRFRDEAGHCVAKRVRRSARILQNGLSTYPEIVSAQRNLASARSVSHDTQSDIFTAATALALSTGDLARPGSSARPLRPSAGKSLER